MSSDSVSALQPHIQSRILALRDQRVILDADLAILHRVETKVLVQAVKRNTARFPADFMFQLTPEEWSALRSRFVTSKGRGGRRYAPYAFTELVLNCWAYRCVPFKGGSRVAINPAARREPCSPSLARIQRLFWQWLESDGRQNRPFHGIACGAR